MPTCGRGRPLSKLRDRGRQERSWRASADSMDGMRLSGEPQLCAARWCALGKHARGGENRIASKMRKDLPLEHKIPKPPSLAISSLSMSWTQNAERQHVAAF